jgi:hypothetical protein
LCPNEDKAYQPYRQNNAKFWAQQQALVTKVHLKLLPSCLSQLVPVLMHTVGTLMAMTAIRRAALRNFFEFVSYVRHSKVDILFDRENTLVMNILLTADECLLGDKEEVDTMLFGIILKIVHKNKSADANYNFFSKSFGKTNNKVRTKTPSFERMIYVADLSNPGMTFVMIFSQEKGSCMLDDLKVDTVIGTPVVIPKPFRNKGNSLQELPVIDPRQELISLK